MWTTHWCVVASILFMVALGPVASAQTIILDTLYTPPGYVDGGYTARIFLPAIRNGNAVVLVHGATGSPHNNRVWCDTLAARGYVAMSIYYPDPRRFSSATYPKKTRAVKTAVEFLRINAERFGIAGGKIVGWGMSQGAHTWGEAIPWDNDDEYFGTNPNVDDRIDAAILLYGRYQRIIDDPFWNSYYLDDPATMEKGACIGNIFRVTSPVLLMHGTSDAVTPPQQSQLLHDSLTAYGKTSQLRLFEDQPHGFDVLLRPLPYNQYEGYAFTSAGLIAKDTALKFLERLFGPFTYDTLSPAAPRGLVIADSLNGTITIRWRKNGEADFQRYRIFRGTSYAPTEQVDSTTSGAADTSRTFSGLTNGTRYYFRVKAVAGSGYESAYSDEVSTVPVDRMAPAVPQELIVFDTSSTKIGIAWRRSAETDFLRYGIYRAMAPEPTVQVDSTNGGAGDTSKIFTGLTNGVRYYLRVTAVDSAGNESAYSNEVSGIPNASVVAVEALGQIPKEFSLFQNRPNPFNPSTEIGFVLPFTSHVSLAVFDLLGREVAMLVDEEKPAGSYTTTWDASGLSSGIYICRLQAGAFVDAKKLLLMR